MTAEELQRLNAEQAAALPALIHALWYDAQGDWHASHEAAQAVESREGAWVHAYLHRKEGDQANAAYWYRRAGQPPATGSLTGEWHEIASALLRSSRRGAAG